MTTDTTPDYSWLDEPITEEEHARMMTPGDPHTCEDHLNSAGICTLCGWDSHESDL